MERLKSEADVETLQIRGYPKWQRIYAACVFGAAGIFFLWLYWENRSSEGSWFGLLVIALCFWLAAYWIRLPKVLGVLTPEGMDYIDQDLALLFYYPWIHFDWDRITGIQTFEQSGKGGPVMVTVLHAGDAESPGKTHSFRISSANMDYYHFMAYLRTVADPATVENNSLPLDPALLRQKLRHDQWQKLGVLFVTALVLVVGTYFIRR
jgi:hypothetical protein